MFYDGYSKNLKVPRYMNEMIRIQLNFWLTNKQTLAKAFYSKQLTIETQIGKHNVFASLYPNTVPTSL